VLNYDVSVIFMLFNIAIMNLQYKTKTVQVKYGEITTKTHKKFKGKNIPKFSEISLRRKY
jgi:hypothetical protein